MARNLSCAILAGGQSRRMGADKALLDWDGVPLVQHIASVVKCALPDLNEVFLVGYRDAYEGLELTVIVDRYPGAGPLGGIATALSHASTKRVFVLGCDLPLISKSLIRPMAGYRTEADVLVPVLAGERSDQGDDLTFETLHAIYSESCLPHIERALREGERRTISFFNRVSVETLSEEWVSRYDPMLESLMNVNRPEDLARAREIRARRSRVGC